MQSEKLLKQLDDLLEHKQYILESCNKMSKWLFSQGKDELAFELLDRAIIHDNSKLETEELTNLSMICDSNDSLVNPNYEMTDFDKKCIELHWKHNRHHPEYFRDMSDMGEIDVIEMVCDWYARSKQLNTNFLEFVFTRQKNRFNFPDEMFKSITKYCYILSDNKKTDLEGVDNMKQEFIFFHSPREEHGYLSNWYFCNFEVDDVKFSSSEQYMMHAKAMLFKDTETANKILKTHDCGAVKALGREVKNFDSVIWDSNKEKIMFIGLLEKFRQNNDIKKKLLSTGDSILAEGAAKDLIWGIGLSMADPRRFNQNEWKGENLLGKILMDVRECLKLERTYS